MATASEMAGQFGYSLAFFNSDPELKRLLDNATTGPTAPWSPDRFVAELRNTNWFVTHGEAFRKYQALKTGDPATLSQMRDQMNAHMGDLANQLGADFTSDQLEQALMFGWSDDQIKRVLESQLHQEGGRFAGQAGTFQAQIMQMVNDYGVDVSNDQIGNWVKGSMTGVSTPDAIKQTLAALASSKYVAFADRLKSGETMRQIADPYVQSMSKILELNPESVSLRDNTIQAALQSKNKDGQPEAQSVWQFEQGLRQDPRWMKTQNAQDLFTKTASDVLKSFGLMGSS